MILLSPSLQSVGVLLEGPSLGYWPFLPALCYQWTCWGGICPSTQIIDEHVKEYWVQHRTLKDSLSGRTPTRLSLIMSFWDLPFSQLSIHLTLHSSSPHSLSLLRVYYERKHQKPCWNQGRKYSVFSPHLFWYFFFYFRTNQVCQAWFTFSEFMLATPDHILGECDQDGLWNEALHHLSGIEVDGSSLDSPWPVCR